MPNEIHLELARQGREVWNAWRAENPDRAADFSGVDFREPENRDISFAGFEFSDSADFTDVTFGDLRVEFLQDVDKAIREGYPPGGGALFEGATFGNGALFEGATFGNGAWFEGATFGDEAGFAGATFGDGAGFEGATFGFDSGFEGATFGDVARLEGVTFGDWAGFEGATFGYGAGFEGATFGDVARFTGATFGYGAQFAGATFGFGAGFEGATFGDGAGFEGATFGDGAGFEGATFGDVARFEGATFGNVANFSGLSDDELDELRRRITGALPVIGDLSEADQERFAERWDAVEGLPRKFTTIDFTRAQFRGDVEFAGRSIKTLANFAGAQFDQPPDLYEFEHSDRLDLAGTRFGFSEIDRRNWVTYFGLGKRDRKNWTTSSDVATRLRRLRKLAADIHASDAERDLFILERLAERGILWAQAKQKENWGYAAAHAKAAAHISLMFLYCVSSDFGRSIWRPIAWLLGVNIGFAWVYSLLLDTINKTNELINLTLSSALPFGVLSAQTRAEALGAILIKVETVPWTVHAASIGQGVVNVTLLFLIGLALRNFFKTK